MGYTEIAIDIGTSYTSIYQKGVGIVLREPSVVVCKNGVDVKGIKAIGIEAKKMIGKNTENTTVIFPVFEGAIVNTNVAIIMLEYFLSKIMPQKIIRPKLKALINIPCGLTEQERKLFETVIFESGIKNAAFVEAPISAAFGMQVPLSKTEPCLVVDIGGGTTDIGVLSLNGMITGCSVGIGGNNIDTGIIDHLAETSSLKVGLLSTERVKIQAGSLFVNDTTTAMIHGRDILTQNPRTAMLSSKDFIDVVEYYYYKILEVIESVVHSLGEEVGGEIKKSGIYICGGASQIAGLARCVGKSLQLDVHMCDEPSYAAIIGAGKLLADKETLKAFL